jgi:hypothetical protein
MAAYDISGRRIRFELYSAKDLQSYEYEIISGSVFDNTHVQHYHPMGQSVGNTVAHGRTVVFQFTGVMLADDLPWYDLEPMTSVTELYVTLNRFDPNIDDPDDPDEVYHYSASAVVTAISHVFSTDSHQIFDVTIHADGDYSPPVTPTS